MDKPRSSDWLLKRFVNWFTFDLALRKKFIVLFFTASLLPLVGMGLLGSYQMKLHLQNMERKALRQSMYQLRNSVDDLLRSYLNLSAAVVRSSELQQALISPSDGLIEAIENRKAINKVVRQMETALIQSPEAGMITIRTNAIVRFYIENDDLSSYEGDILPLDQLRSETWFAEVMASPGKSVWQSMVIVNGDNYVVLNHRILNLEDYHPIGILRVYIPLSAIKDQIDRNMPAETKGYFIVDQDDVNILSSEREEFAEWINRAGTTELTALSSQAGDQDYLMGDVTSTLTNWRFYFIIPSEAVERSTKYITENTMLSVLVALLISMVFSGGITGLVVKRLALVVQKAKSIGSKGECDSGVVYGKDEFSDIDRNLTIITKEIKELTQRDMKAQLLVQQAQLELLQEQINPHLLYNTLSLINMTALEKGDNDTSQITNNLIEFYRGILNKGQFVTSFREEVEMVRNYVDITRRVYQLDIQLDIDLDPLIMEGLTLKLILQPIVENAILHGLRPKGGGRVDILGSIEEGLVDIYVSDDGIGMPAETVRYLNSLGEGENGSESFGIANVLKRIHLFWGRNFGVKVQSDLSTGTIIHLQFPYMTEKEILNRNMWVNNTYNGMFLSTQ